MGPTDLSEKLLAIGKATGVYPWNWQASLSFYTRDKIERGDDAYDKLTSGDKKSALAPGWLVLNDATDDSRYSHQSHSH